MIDPSLMPNGLGWCLYAFAGEDVTIEIIDAQGQTFQVKAPTVEECWLYVLDVLGIDRPALPGPDPRIERLKAESDEKDAQAAAIAASLFESAPVDPPPRPSGSRTSSPFD